MENTNTPTSVKSDNEDYGTITIGYGTSEQSELKIVDFVRSIYKDYRVAGMSLIEDGTYCINIENFPSSGRNTQNTMRLSEESLIALLTNCMLYFQVKNIDLMQLLQKAMASNNIDYTISDNLKPLNENGE